MPQLYRPEPQDGLPHDEWEAYEWGRHLDIEAAQAEIDLLYTEYGGEG